MKKTALIFLLTILTASCLIYIPYDENRRRPQPAYEPAPPPPPAPVYGQISINFIYDYLGRFGVWVSYHPYGYVWIPRGVGRHWRPYTHGRWVWTEYGWTWISYHPWGWIPFHYGRWGYDPRLGWFWVPDVVWAPAWVVWRYSDLYIGWAPLPPGVEFVPGYGLRWRTRDIPPHYWIFVEGRRFGENQLQAWVLPPERNITIINYTVIKDRYTIRERTTIINDALSPREIERLSQRPVTSVKLREVKSPEESGLGPDEVRIYKPNVKMEEAAPKSVLRREEAEQKIRPLNEEEPPQKVEEIHRQEKILLERTQRLELENMKKQIDEELRQVPPRERQKKKSELQVKLEELKKKHQQEKQELEKRQTEEKKVLKKEGLKRKSEAEKY